MKTSRVLLLVAAALLAAALLAAACSAADPVAPARPVQGAPRATTVPTDTLPGDVNRTPFMGGSAG